MIPKKVPEDAVGAQTPETKPRVPFAVGDVAEWAKLKVRVLAERPNAFGEPRLLVESVENPTRYIVRDQDLSPWVEPEAPSGADG